MDLSTKTTEYASENHSWLRGEVGTNATHTIELDAAAFQDNFAALGYIPSGVVLARVGNKGVPYDDAASDGSEVAVGHLFTSKPLNKTEGPIVAALYTRGQVVEANLPTNHGLDAAAKADLPLIEYV